MMSLAFGPVTISSEKPFPVSDAFANDLVMLPRRGWEGRGDYRTFRDRKCSTSCVVRRANIPCSTQGIYIKSGELKCAWHLNFLAHLLFSARLVSLKKGVALLPVLWVFHKACEIGVVCRLGAPGHHVLFESQHCSGFWLCRWVVPSAEQQVPRYRAAKLP